MLSICIGSLFTLLVGSVAYAAALDPCIPLIITHPHQYYDHDLQAREGILSRIAEHQKCASDIRILLDPTMDHYLPKEAFQAKDFSQAFSMIQTEKSNGGETQLFFPGNEIEIVGGYFELCFWQTVSFLVFNRHHHQLYDNLTIKVPVKAVYSTFIYGTTLLEYKMKEHHYSLQEMDADWSKTGFSARDFEAKLDFDNNSKRNICVEISYRGQTMEGKLPRTGCKTILTLQLFDS